MTKPIYYRVGSIVIIDDGCNLAICKSHTPSERIVIEHADREDLLTCIMLAQDRRTGLIDRELSETLTEPERLELERIEAAKAADVNARFPLPPLPE